MKRLMLLSVMLSVLSADPTLALVPSTMSYQGVLMDNSGALLPDGNYSLTFKLYTVSAGGVAVWSETHNPVALSRGGFSVILGSVVPLAGIAFDVPYWLGITVGAGTELSPRVELASSPYGLGLRLPFAGGVSSAGPALMIGNNSTGPAITADPLLSVGTTARNGAVEVYENGIVGARIGNWLGTYGGYLRLYDPSGNWTARIEPDIDGSGGWFEVWGSGGSFKVEGNDGVGGPVVTIAGSSSTTLFNTTLNGNDAVQLPPTSVSASEILDEPGIAQGHANGTITVPVGTTMSDIITVTLTTPADGYIVVHADGQHACHSSATATYNEAYIQIDETAGGVFDSNHYFLSGYSGSAGSHNFYQWNPISIHRTYYKTAGIYTFRLEAFAVQNEELLNYIYNPTITATFYPTGYGSVTTAVTPDEAARFTDVRHTASVGQAPQDGTSDGYLVDLRELELRAAEARLQAEQAQRRLLEARLTRQNEAAPRPATTKQP